MLDKLEKIVRRLDEVERQLSDPAVYSDRDAMTKLSREQKELTPVAEAYRAYARAEADIAAATEMLSDSELKELLGGEIRCAKYALPGTKGLCKNTVEAMKGRKGCFLANHGVFACGESMDLAFEAIRAMEKGCRDYIEAQTAKALGKSSYDAGDDVVLFLKK